MFMMRAQNKGEVNDDRGKIGRKRRRRETMCLVLPAYEKFHTTSSCDVMLVDCNGYKWL
jgi:hypothetical protein